MGVFNLRTGRIFAGTDSLCKLILLNCISSVDLYWFALS